MAALSSPAENASPAQRDRTQAHELSRNAVLDVIRSVAALAVMFSHTRAFIFQNFPALISPGIATKAFYYATGFGHQAVVVFFVLSGYLVGGSVWRAREEGFWPKYIIQRLSRLWVVLVPCLLATLLWNLLGRHWGGAAYLQGALNPPVAVAPQGMPVQLGAVTFLGNLVFLQTILVPVYGDNGPLWSLCNEFWYYIIYPLFVLALLRDIVRVRQIIYLGCGLALLFLLPRPIPAGFLVWMSGAMIAAVETRPIGAFLRSSWVGVFCIGLCLALLHISRVAGLADIPLGLSFALILPVALKIPMQAAATRRLATFFSQFSYTLYLSHFSFIAFLWVILFRTERVAPSAAGSARFILVSAAAVAYAWLMSLPFERRTSRLQKRLRASCGLKA